MKFGKKSDNYDVTNPKVIAFLHDVLSELFPSKVIHIGGDEINYISWLETERVQAYMKENNINTPADLKIEFSKTFEKNEFKK